MWGHKNKCYTYDPSSKSSETVARKKATAQGVAIGDFQREALDNVRGLAGMHFSVDRNRVSIDYDGTLSTPKGKLLAERLMREGKTVYIVTARMITQMGPVYDAAKRLGIPRSRVYSTNGQDKYGQINRLGIGTHYDNNEEQVKKINDKTEARGILFE